MCGERAGFPMDTRAVFTLGVALLLGTGLALAGPVTSAPDPVHGKDLAERLCTNCHLVGSGQQHANAEPDARPEVPWALVNPELSSRSDGRGTSPELSR